MDTASRFGFTDVSTPTDTDIAVTRDFDAPRELVWEVWTDPKHLPHWLTGPPGWSMTVCEIDLRPGGPWRMGWRSEEGAELLMHGVYREVSPPERIVSSENWGGDWPETINTIALTEEAGATRLTLTIRYPSMQARDAALNSGMKDGMDASFGRFEERLRSMA